MTKKKKNLTTISVPEFIKFRIMFPKVDLQNISFCKNFKIMNLLSFFSLKFHEVKRITPHIQVL